MFYGSFTHFSAAPRVVYGANNAKVMGSISLDSENR